MERISADETNSNSTLIEQIRLSHSFTGVRDQGQALMIAASFSGAIEAIGALGDDAFELMLPNWVKWRANRSQEFVIGGYIPNGNVLDSILVGYYVGHDLMYAASARAGIPTEFRRLLPPHF